MFAGCADKVVGLRHPWGGPARAGVVSSPLWSTGKDEGFSAAGRGCSTQGDGAEGGVTGSGKNRRDRKEKDSRALYPSQ